MRRPDQNTERREEEEMQERKKKKKESHQNLTRPGPLVNAGGRLHQVDWHLLCRRHLVFSLAALVESTLG